jgi:putative ABC transport system ATP-binding protein
VRLGGTELTGLGERRLTLLRRERIGFVFQSFNLLPSLTAEQNVALPLRLAGRRPRRAEVRQALRRVGLGDRARHRPAELSGGQQQRVALARALITRPEVLFADEPTGALDSVTGRQVLTLLREMVDTDGRTLVMVTHDPVAAAYADRVVFLVDGRVHGEVTGATAGGIAARMTSLETSRPTPDASGAPGMSEAPGATGTPGMPEWPGTPGTSDGPGTTRTSDGPGTTEAPDTTGTPAATETPGATGTPAATEAPDTTGTPAATEAPDSPAAPATTAAPGATEALSC